MCMGCCVYTVDSTASIMLYVYFASACPTVLNKQTCPCTKRSPGTCCPPDGAEVTLSVVD
jgi:hypothetical protein